MIKVTEPGPGERPSRKRSVELSAEARKIMVVMTLFAIGAALARRFIGEYAVDWVVIASHFVAPYVHGASKPR